MTFRKALAIFTVVGAVGFATLTPALARGSCSLGELNACRTCCKNQASPAAANLCLAQCDQAYGNKKPKKDTRNFTRGRSVVR